MTADLRRAWATRIASRGDEPVYYHGTAKAPGFKMTEVTPAGSRPSWHPVTFPHDHDPEHAYATTSLRDAWDWAAKAHDTHFKPGSKIVPRVFKVKPRGHVEEDPVYGDNGPRNVSSSDARSKHGFDVQGEEKMPSWMGTHEDWK